MPPAAPGKHPDLQGHADAHRCSGKPLIGRALVGFGVRTGQRRPQRVNGRYSLLGRLIVSDGCLIEIDHDEGSRPRIDGLKRM